MQITVNRETKIKKITLVLENEDAENFVAGVCYLGRGYDSSCKPPWVWFFDRLAKEIDSDC